MPEAKTWNEWVDRHGAAALLFARHYAASLADAQDAVQDGFVRFWQQRESARDPLALLFTCVRSAAIDQQRSQHRRDIRERKIAQERPMFLSPGADASLRTSALEEALQELPEPQRAVIVLKTWAGLTFAQIAQSLGESPNTVASRYRYGLEKLSEILAPEVRHE